MKKIMRLITLALFCMAPAWVAYEIALHFGSGHFLLGGACFGRDIRRAVLRAGRL